MAHGSSVFLFRFSASVLVIGVEFLACLLGKLIKERSLVLYNYFYSFCTGILLASGLSWFLFQGIINESQDTSTAFSSFSLSMVTLVSFHVSSKSSNYEYQKVIGVEDEEDDEDLGIELAEANHNLPSANFDLEVEARRKRKPSSSGVGRHEDPATDQDEVKKQNELWQRIVLAGLVTIELTKGVILASEQHASMFVFMNVVLMGILQAFAFGVLCEESIANPSVYIRSILILVSALPLGMIISVLLPLEGGTVSKLAGVMNCFACGIFASAAICYMIPMNDMLSTALFSSVGNKDRLGILRFKAFLFVAGYAIAAMCAWI
jgi:hypothetical protein